MTDFKYAELPDGRRLQFPADTPESVIRKTVRRELGVENLNDAVEALDKQMKEIAKAHKQTMADMTNSLAKSSKIMSGDLAAEVTSAMRQLIGSNERMAEAMRKAITSQSNLTLRLAEQVEALNKTLDAALGESLSSIDESRALTGKAIARIDGSMNAMNALAHRVATAIEGLAELRMTRRRAVRVGNGCYEFQTVE